MVSFYATSFQGQSATKEETEKKMLHYFSKWLEYRDILAMLSFMNNVSRRIIILQRILRAEETD